MSALPEPVRCGSCGRWFHPHPSAQLVCRYCGSAEAVNLFRRHPWQAGENGRCQFCGLPQPDEAHSAYARCVRCQQLILPAGLCQEHHACSLCHDALGVLLP